MTSWSLGHALLVDQHCLIGDIDPGGLTEQHCRIALIPQDRADRRGDVGGRQTRGRLVKQRLEKVVIAVVDQGHVHRSMAQANAALRPPKPPPIMTTCLIGIYEHPVRLRSFWTQPWVATVIWCRRAVNPGEAHQRRTAERLKAKWFELDTGHYPMLSMPGELTALLTAEA